jgi:hypothetical protein
MERRKVTASNAAIELSKWSIRRYWGILFLIERLRDTPWNTK